jgi:hypothetical protein
MVKRLLPDFAVALLLGWASAHLGLWFVPFVLGVVAWAIRPPARGVVPAVVAGATAGWALALWVVALHGLPVGATGRSIAALAGLPPYAATAIAVTLLLAALQVLAGAWLARAVLPRRRGTRTSALPGSGHPKSAIDSGLDKT